MDTVVEVEPLGRVEVADESVYSFPNGMPGFPSARRFGFVTRTQDTPFGWMVSLDQPDLAFVVVNPLELVAEYSPRLSPEDLLCLGVEEQSQAVLYAIVNIPEDPRGMTLNLRAPVALHPGQRLGRQAILAGQDYSTRHRVFGEAAVSAPACEADGGAADTSHQAGQGRRDDGACTDTQT